MSSVNKLALVLLALNLLILVSLRPFLAVPCCLHGLPSHAAATLHLSSRGRWTPPGCWWKCEVKHSLHWTEQLVILTMNVFMNCEKNVFPLRETFGRTILILPCKYWEMQEILEAAEGASGTQEGVKEALKVCLLRDWLTDSLQITYISHIIMYDALHNFHRPVQCVQDSEDDHGEELSARHHFQLQQERVRGLRSAGGQAGLQQRCVFVIVFITVPVHQIWERNWSNRPSSQPYLVLSL